MRSPSQSIATLNEVKKSFLGARVQWVVYPQIIAPVPQESGRDELCEYRHNALILMALRHPMSLV